MSGHLCFHKPLLLSLPEQCTLSYLPSKSFPLMFMFLLALSLYLLYPKFNGGPLQVCFLCMACKAAQHSEWLACSRCSKHAYFMELNKAVLLS